MAEPDPRLRITTTADLLKAVELGIVDKTEARGMLGLPVRRGRLARLQPRQGGRFVKGDQVYPLNRFTGPAQQAMIRAQASAAEAAPASAEDQVHIGTGHMLLALLQQDGGAAARALESIGVAEEQVRSQLAACARQEDVIDRLGPTSQLKTAMETAFEAVGYPQQVGTWHLLLALASCEGRARDVLAQVGARAEVLRGMEDRLDREDD